MNDGRIQGSVALLDERIYAMGEHNRHRWQISAERYNPQTNRWKVLASMNEERCQVSATSVNGKVTFTIYNDTIFYDVWLVARAL